MLAAIEKALKESDRWRIDHDKWFLKFADGREQYHSLRRFFSELSARPIDRPTILIGALAIYGWMPSMMPSYAIRTDAEALIYGILGGEKVRSGKFFFLTSPSATSKFLHFLAPTQFFICDSRVQNALGWPSITMNRYLDYCSALASPDSENIARRVLPRFPQMVRDDPDFSAGCAVEAALFCIGMSTREISEASR